MVLDTETRDMSMEEHRRLSWRLGCAAYFTSDTRRGMSDFTIQSYSQPFELWADVHSKMSPGHRLVVWCHNLAFDLRVSRALEFLPAMGYELEQIALDHNAAWARFTLGDATLQFCDLMTWLPASLGQIASELGMRKLPMPAPDAPDGEWRKYCARDVQITTAAVRELLGFVEEYDLGPWRPTGPGQAHSAWRRRWMTERVLVHDDLAVLAAERRAAWTGRCEAWRHGILQDGPYTEFDLSLAYCQIAADSAVPSVLVGPRQERDLDRLLAACDRHCVLVHLEIETDEPIVPVEDDGRILWPVGRFSTWLWDPELELVRRHAKSWTVDQVFLYRKAPALKAACEWIIAGLSPGAAQLAGVRRRLLKHWARALIGRCALRYRTWEEWGTSDTEGLSLGVLYDQATDTEHELMQVGRQLRIQTEVEEAPDSVPQIPGWVMSECRRRLWELMGIAGHEHLIYVDTDSLIVDREGARRLELHAHEPGAWPLHVKGVYERAAVWAPRALELDGSRRMAGIPLGAQADRRGRMRGEVFVGLRESLLRHQLSAVDVLSRSFEPGLLDRRRRHMPGGDTLPYSIPVTT